MQTPNFTVVLGVDARHIEHLEAVLPTWAKFKPSLMERPFVVFLDSGTDVDQRVRVSLAIAAAGIKKFTLVSWPYPGIEYPLGDGTKWNDQQRYKMLAGFVHVPARHVETSYWLKLDLDVVAHDIDDWIDPKWFDERPAIIAHRWSYTKPPDQMMKLDDWAVRNFHQLNGFPYRAPLNLIPSSPAAGSLGHKRIISWCGFFNTVFTSVCSDLANDVCGLGKLPVPSQDGYLWYMAQASGYLVRRENMKARGWHHCANIRVVREKVLETK